jgi:hypothetical protein
MKLKKCRGTNNSLLIEKKRCYDKTTQQLLALKNLQPKIIQKQHNNCATELKICDPAGFEFNPSPIVFVTLPGWHILREDQAAL